MSELRSLLFSFHGDIHVLHAAGPPGHRVSSHVLHLYIPGPGLVAPGVHEPQADDDGNQADQAKGSHDNDPEVGGLPILLCNFKFFIEFMKDVLKKTVDPGADKKKIILMIGVKVGREG